MWYLILLNTDFRKKQRYQWHNNTKYKEKRLSQSKYVNTDIDIRTIWKDDLN